MIDFDRDTRMTTAAQRIARAESVLAITPPVIYSHKLGPFTPGDVDDPWHWSGCDCSTFACWCAGVAKHDGKIWWGTGNIVADAMTRVRPRRWERLDAPERGCVVVFTAKPMGHCGIVTAIEDERIETIEARGRPDSRIVRDWRERSWWAKRGAIFVVPKGDT